MSVRIKDTRSLAARCLVGIGSLSLAAGAVLHLTGGYPLISAGVLASNLNTELQSALRCVFLIVGWHWLMLAAIAMIAAFLRASAAKAIVLLCAVALIVDGALMAKFLGWFVGTDMILASAVLILCGGFVLAPVKRVVEEFAG
jgi:hypothetical protein